MRNYKSLVMLLGAAVALVACDKNGVQDITEPPPGGAAVKFFNFAVGAPPVDFYANDTKMTGVSTTTGTTYGNAGTGGWYDDIAPGQYTFEAKTVPAGTVLGAATTTVGPAKFYSYYLSGLYDATGNTADSFVIEDQVPAWDYTNANVRFVNAIYNSTPLTLYAKNTITGVEVPIGGATAFAACDDGPTKPPPVRLLQSAGLDRHRGSGNPQHGHLRCAASLHDHGTR